MADAQTERPFNTLIKHFENCESVNPEARKAAFALTEALRALDQMPVDAQAVILNGPAALWLEAQEGEGSEAGAQQAVQQLETCRIGTCQGIIFDVNSLQVSVSQLDRLGGADGQRRSQSLVEPTLNTIRDDLALLHFTTLARASMLCAQGNPEGCAKLLAEYAAFLDETVIRNGSLLERLAANGPAWKNLAETAQTFAQSL